MKNRVRNGLVLASVVASALVAISGTAAAQTTLEELFEKTKAAGESEVVVYGPPSARLRTELGRLFSERFAGVTLNISGMAGGKLVSKITSEARAGVHGVDVVMSGTSTLSKGLKPSGLIQPLDPMIVLPDVRDGKNWLGGKIAWADDQRTMVVMASLITMCCAINTDLVKPNELSGDADLLNPKWKGKIVSNDPMRPGAGFVAWRRFYDQHGPEFISRLVKDQGVVFAKELRQPIDWLAKGTYAIAIGASSSVANDYMSKGIGNIGIDHNATWKEPLTNTAGFGQLAVASNPPHPNAAKLFVNWILTREGQTALGIGLEYASRRIDAEVPGIPEALKPRPDGTYTEGYTEEWADHPNSERLRSLMRTLTAN